MVGTAKAGAPVLDPTWERAVVKFLRATRHSPHSRSLPMRFFARCAPNSDHSIAGVANDATGQFQALASGSGFVRTRSAAWGTRITSWTN
jgi:hypothetical protein